MERGSLEGENARFAPCKQATRRAWGICDSLACRGSPGLCPGKRRQAMTAELV